MSHHYADGDDPALTAEQILDLFDLRPAWQAEANCRGRTDEMFPASPQPGRGGVNHAEIRYAKEAICGNCTVHAECHDWMIEASVVNGIDTGGVWAGTTKTQRVRLRAKRGRVRSNTQLTANTVRELRARAAAGETYKDLAAEYGVDSTTVSQAVRRITWKDLT